MPYEIVRGLSFRGIEQVSGPLFRGVGGDQHVAKLTEPSAIPGQVPPDKADDAPRLRRREAPGCQPWRRGTFGRCGNLRKEGEAEALGCETAERGEAGRPEVGPGLDPVDSAGGNCLVGQAVPVVEQKQLAGAHVGRLNPLAEGIEGTTAAGEQKAVLEEWQADEARIDHREGDDNGVQQPVTELVEKHLGLRLPDPEIKREVAGAQERQRRRQEIGSDGRDDADPKPARDATGPTRNLFDVAGLGKDAACAAQDLAPCRSEDRPARAALDEHRAKSRLQPTHLHREGRLRDVHGFRRAAEMTGVSQGDEAFELAKGKTHKVDLS